MLTPSNPRPDLNALLMQKRARELAKTYAAKRKRDRRALAKQAVPPLYRRSQRPR